MTPITPGYSSIDRLSFFRPPLHHRIVCAHRGFSAQYPENTMPAFEAAWEAGADMIELDVRFSSDGVPVVIHDPNINRVTDGRGRVSRMTAEQLREADAGNWYRRAFAGTRIPTLGQVLTYCRGKLTVNIEVKDLPRNMEERLLQTVHDTGMAEHVLFSSFDWSWLERLRQADAGIAIALLADRAPGNGTELLAYLWEHEAQALHGSRRVLSGRLLALLREQHIPFQVYTINQPGVMRKFLEQGAAGIVTNRPDRLIRVVQELFGEEGDIYRVDAGRV